MTAPTPHGPHRHPVGPLAQEAALLFDAVAERVAGAQAAARQRSTAARPEGADPTPAAESPCPECGHPISDGTGGTPQACTSCPWCRLLTVLRGDRPDLTVAVLDAAGTLLSALRGLIPDPNDPRPDAADPAAPAAPTDFPAAAQSAAPADRVVRIEVR